MKDSKKTAILSNIDVKAYGLLFVEPGASSAENLHATISFDKSIDIYCGCALTLARSLERIGIEFVLATNCVATIEASLDRLSASLEIVELSDEYSFPKDLSFYSAHQIYALMKHVSSEPLDYAVILDLDMIATGAISNDFVDAALELKPLVYVESQHESPAEVKQKIIAQRTADLGVLIEAPNDPVWYGGEFISGPPSFFRGLVEVVDTLVPKYIEGRHKLLHQGDETLTTAALALMSKQGAQFADAGALHIVRRFWGEIDPRHQEPLGNRTKYMFLHLPSEKEVLFEMREMPPQAVDQFLSRYCRAMRSEYPKWFRKYLQKPLRKIRRRVRSSRS